MDDPAFDRLAAEQPGIGLRERRIRAAGVDLHVVEAGPPDGPPVVLLHGFPEFWWGWRRQIPPLAGAGWRVVAPDLPGYNLSAKPRGLAAYGLDRLADGVEDLLEAVAPGAGTGAVPLVGHDWGGVLAWWVVRRSPARISRLAILNAPDPGVLRRVLRHSRAQRRRMRYAFYFQLPWLPERKLAAGGFRPLRSIFRRTSRPGTFTEAELDAYAAAAARPGALTGMLNWYRAALWRPPRRLPRAPVEPPVLLLWGLDDAALGRELIEPCAARCREVEVVGIEGAGHWLEHEAAPEVERRLLAFLASPG
jgi:pimeloyl-ACP methyl ester carboxylesterase